MFARLLKSKKSVKSRRTRRLGLESLEDRRLMATFHVGHLVDRVDADRIENPTVTTGLSVREAVVKANNNPGHDEIVLPDGTTSLRASDGGPLFVSDDLTIRAAGDLGATIDGGGHWGSVIWTENSSLTLINIKITGGHAWSRGGGIYQFHGTVRLSEGSSVSGNVASGEGGGIFSHRGRLELSESSVSQNVALEDGGGIYARFGTLKLDSGSSVVDNISANGGGIAIADSSVELSGGSTVSANRAKTGGGIWQWEGDLTLSDGSSVTENTAYLDGGGMFLEDDATLNITNSSVAGNRTGVFEFRNTEWDLTTFDFLHSQFFFFDLELPEENVSEVLPIFQNNESTLGGGAYTNGSGAVTISDSQFANNLASYGGGAYTNGSGAVAISDSQFANNLASYGGGAYIYGSGAVAISDSQFANNLASYGGGAYIYGSGAVAISDSQFANNLASYGGGADINGSDAVTISDSQFTDNEYGASITGSGAATISRTQFTNNRIGGGIIHSETVTISDSQFTDNGYGASIRGSGALAISNSQFANNLDSRGAYISEFDAVTIFDSQFTGNFGGGAYIAGSGSVSLTNTHIADNIARLDGGGIYVRDSILTVSGGSSISGNTTEYGRGGGIFSESTDMELGHLDVDRSVIVGNKALRSSGGGIYISDGSATIKDTTIDNNEAGNSGAGIMAAGDLDVDGSTISHNTSSAHGAGIYMHAGRRVSLVNTTISTNTVTGEGKFAGGILNAGGHLEITHSTIANNGTNGQVGGVVNLTINSSSPSAMINNTIVAGNWAGSAHVADDYWAGTNTTGTGNLFGYYRGAPPTGNLINTDPWLGPLKDNGGPTKTHALLPDSPAIDAGIDALAEALLLDQRGPGFARLEGSAVDIGAFEYRGQWKFDFGTDSSPVAAGYEKVTADTLYTPGGFGWVSPSSTSTQRHLDRSSSGANDLERDYCYMKDATFKVALENGTYRVTATFGDGRFSRDGMAMDLEGNRVGSVDTAANEFKQITGTVTVTDGVLEVRFHDEGGNARVTVNSLEITRVP